MRTRQYVQVPIPIQIHGLTSARPKKVLGDHLLLPEYTCPKAGIPRDLIIGTRACQQVVEAIAVQIRNNNA